MGNCLFSCLNPTAYVCEDDITKYDHFTYVEKRRNNSNSLEQLYTPNFIDNERIEYFGKIPNVYSTDLEEEYYFQNEHCEFTSSTINRLTLNDHRLSSELFNLNLTEMSRDLQQFQDDLSLDSGFSGSRAMSPLALESSALDMISIKVDSLSRFSAKQFNTSLYNKSLSFCFGLINMSLTNMPFLSRNIFNGQKYQKSDKKNGTKGSIFSPKFMAEMKGKVLQKVAKKAKAKCLKDSKKEDENQCATVVVNKSSVSQQQATGLVSTFTPLKNFLFRIYDVNTF